MGGVARREGRQGERAGAGTGKATPDILARLNRTRTGAVAKDGARAKGGGRQGGRALLGGGSAWVPSERNRPSKEAAAARLAAAREALASAAGVVRVVARERTDGVVKVKETRNFAGKQMEVVKTYESGSREAKAAAKRDAAEKHGGLDSVLLQLEKQKKLNVLDKTKLDWSEVMYFLECLEE